MKDKNPLSIKLSVELHDRLQKAAAETRIKKHALAELAIEAAVNAIEKNGYSIVMPMKFDVTHVAVPNFRQAPIYPAHLDETSHAEDRPLKGSQPKAAA